MKSHAVFLRAHSAAEALISFSGLLAVLLYHSGCYPIVCDDRPLRCCWCRDSLRACNEPTRKTAPVIVD